MDEGSVIGMSRAFVKEDVEPDPLPDRPLSEHPNLVTPRGLALLDEALAAAQRAQADAAAIGDRDALARSRRDLRYWAARRASAQVVTSAQPDSVCFGCSVSIRRDDGRRQTFRIVGEDEADPAQGSISYVAPLARALLGKRLGDVVEAGNGEAEVVEIA
jgi:transcription elongation GreA/GreB family factor